MLKIRFIGALLTLSLSLSWGVGLFAEETKPVVNADQSVILSPNDCALFVWVGYPSRLLYISRGRDRLTYTVQDGPKRFSTNLNRGPDKFGQFANQNLFDGTQQSTQIQLETPTDLSENLLYNSGTMTKQVPDGWLHIENAQAVSTCNHEAFDKIINLNRDSGHFEVPQWLKTPAQLAETQLADINTQQAAQTPRSSQPDIEVIAERKIIVEAPYIEPVELVSSRPNNAPLETVEQTLTTPPVTDVYSANTVQIGAFPTADIAHQAWTKFQQKADYLHQKESIVQMAKIEGLGLLYRLRIKGFSDRDSAVAFCARLKSDGIDCFAPRIK